MSHKCLHCEKEFDHKGHYNEHLKVHSDIREYQCDICSKSFKRASHLADHKKVHLPKEFKCYCGKEFTYKSNLTQHMKRHDIIPKKAKREKKIVLVLCGLCFQKIPMDLMDNHMATTHKPDIQDVPVDTIKPKQFYVCPNDECGKKFVSAYNCDQHYQAIHQKQRNYQCMTCKKTFGYKSALIRHSKLHKEALKIKCPLCLEVFTNLSTLTQHMTEKHKQEDLEGESLLKQWYGILEDTEEIIDIC